MVSALQHANKTVATAESLTGGYIAKTLTDISGASAVLEGAVVSYSDRIKHKLLGVQTQTLQTYTAVSAQTAAEMAEGIRLAVGADIGISVTGVAGPTGGTAQTPVGCVFLGCATQNGVAVTRLQCGGHASKTTSQATHVPVADVKEEHLTKAAGEQTNKRHRTKHLSPTRQRPSSNRASSVAMYSANTANDKITNQYFFNHSKYVPLYTVMSIMQQRSLIAF